jgi:hypothetical protein
MNGSISRALASRSLAGQALAALASVILMTGCGGNIGSGAVGSSLIATKQSAQSAIVPDTGSPAEIGNWWVDAPNPSGPPATDFEVVFTGNVTADIPSNEPTSGIYNAFCPPSPPNPCPPTVTYNPTANTTTVEYSGSTLYQNNAPPHQNQYHFGLLNGPGGSRIKCLTRATEWTFASAPPAPTPYVNVSNCKKRTGKHVYATVYLEASVKPINASQPATFGGWYDVAYTPQGNNQPHFTFSNSGPQTIYIANSGIVINEPVPSQGACVKNPACPANMKLLQKLNFGGMPPPGSPGSPFKPMTYPPPSQLPPG